MPINPIVYTEKIVRSFLKYQLTTFPFADTRLHDQLRRELNVDHVRRTSLMRGPYISLSRGFRVGASVDELIADHVLHPHMKQIIPGYVSNVYGHQEKAIRSIQQGKTTLVSTGTGSGKTECFLYPIISKCLELKDEKVPAGIAAVIVYPMNALAEDQLDRLRGILAGSGITFGMYVGKTPEHEREVSGVRLESSASNADYQSQLEDFRSQGRPDTIHPYEEVCSREMMRTPGRQPRILLTNVKQLELLLTRQTDVELFKDARLDYLAFDEAHTFTGIVGAETACLIRRLRTFCGTDADRTTCVATSATIVDASDPNAACKFAARFFGVQEDAVITVNEEYQQDEWEKNRFTPPAPITDVAQLLAETLDAVDAEEPDQQIRDVYRQLTTQELPDVDWRIALFDGFRANEIAAQIRTALRGPRELYLLLRELGRNIRREVSEEELLCYLTLGAASLKEGRPLLRPVVHGFIRGISGGVVSFEDGQEPRLWLSSAEELERGDDGDRKWRPKLFACSTCGQHYFITALKDFSFTGSNPDGGQMSEDGGAFWESLEETNGGNRVVITDRLVSMDDEEAEDSSRTQPIYFCRYCGSAHPNEFSRCGGCGSVSDPVKLLAIKSKETSPGYLSSCLSCKKGGRSMGRRYREPIREVRATNVADVHVLAQDMVHHAQRKRLLVFADNRQDAAFQAGWMKDRARRFRLRSLMARVIAAGSDSVSDIALRVSDILDGDQSMSRALIPEVWRAVPKEGRGGAHEDERLHFLRIQVLRELTMAANQQLGLEPWGRIKIEYQNLAPSSAFIQKWARSLGLPPDELKAGVEALLDHLRRRQLLHDSRRGIFGRFWQDGDREIQRGYMPVPSGGPQGMKLRLDTGDDRRRVRPWITGRNTLVRSIARKWGVDNDDCDEFLEELWAYLTSEDVAVLVPVTLRGSKDRPLPNCSGVYQVDSSKIRVTGHHGVFRCTKCRRKSSRRNPHQRCLAWQCDGTIEFVQEDPDNYDLQLLDQQYAMLKPEEHTAMVPQEHRERIENWFKGDSDVVNTLVCTPTLELGVDIGSLDSVLLKNVPPLPANYWQRAGRAGRRHRMAVNMTYCRPVSHDRAYFDDPLRMLNGRVDPPAFNLRNELMISKHVHAVIITRLNQLAHEDSGLPETERKRISDTLLSMLPKRINSYLFETSGQLRPNLFDVNPLGQLIGKYRSDLLLTIKNVFQQGWPNTDADVTTDRDLEKHVDDTAKELQIVIRRLRSRLQWAYKEISRLNKVREEQGTLDGGDDAHFRRCDRMIKRLKGTYKRRRNEAEGFDGIITFGVMAAEGFLPGYGLDSGSVRGNAEVPYWHLGSVDFTLPRSPSMALREYVPGNLIYANGHKFVARRFHRTAEGEHADEPIFEVNVERQAVTLSDVGAAAAALGSTELQAIPVCDVDLVHQSQIGDDEENRFQMSVGTFGRERGRHNGGEAYDWGEKQLKSRRGVHYRMVNVGPSSLIERTPPELGFPVCMVCGQSVSPLSSEAQINQFRERHDERCGKRPDNIGFYADIVADSLSVTELDNHRQAYSLLEAIRMAATRVLDMHLQDLQILVVGHVDRDEVDATLWDPMPGGSGLLQQIKEHFQEITGIAYEILNGCPADCGGSCSECLQNFRNGFYHRFLDRHEALELLERWGRELGASHPIPPSQPVSSGDADQQPVNNAETKLKHLLEAASFTSGVFQEQIRFNQPIMLDHQIGSTTPDVFYEGDPDDEDDRGTCVYLDGMSRGLHGNPKTAAKDHEIRSWLRNNGFNVISIAVNELDDRGAMVQYFKRLARFLEGKSLANEIGSNDSWFDQGQHEPQKSTENSSEPAIVEPSRALEPCEVESLKEIVSPDCLELLDSIVKELLPLPKVGFDAVDDTNIVIGECELAWPSKKIAVLTPDQTGLSEKLTEQGWRIYLSDCGDKEIEQLIVDVRN